MKIYRITLKHDTGRFTIDLHGASSEESARKMICTAEGCPESAIVKVREVGT